MKAKLYGFSISNPTISVGLMLEFKGIEFESANVMPGTQRLAMRAHGFGGGTVPGLKLDGRALLGSTRISRALDELQPEPRLFPSDPAHRAAVEEAEAWADDVLQTIPRRAYRWGLARSRPLRRNFAETMQFPLPALSAALSGPVSSHYARLVSADDETVRAGLTALPGLLDQVDALIANGTIGGEQPNAADFQIAPSVRLMLTFADLRSAIEGRPAADHARALVPDYPGDVPPFLPRDWLAALKAPPVHAE